MAVVASNKATRIDLFSMNTPQMRAFHLTWIAFFVCFYAWFATAPLMPIISADLHFTKADGANIAIAGVFATILARFAIGPMCDKYGPRITYTLLLAFGALPVIGIAFAWDYTSFLVFRLLIGIIGASPSSSRSSTPRSCSRPMSSARRTPPSAVGATRAAA